MCMPKISTLKIVVNLGDQNGEPHKQKAANQIVHPTKGFLFAMLCGIVCNGEQKSQERFSCSTDHAGSSPNCGANSRPFVVPIFLMKRYI